MNLLLLNTTSWMVIAGGLFWLCGILVVLMFLVNLFGRLFKRNNLNTITQWVSTEPERSQIGNALALGKILYHQQVMKNAPGVAPHVVSFDVSQRTFHKDQYKKSFVPHGAFIRAMQLKFDEFTFDKRKVYTSPDEGVKICIGEARLGQEKVYLTMNVTLVELSPEKFGEVMDSFEEGDLITLEGSPNKWAYFLVSGLHVIARPEFDRKIDFINTAIESTKISVVYGKKDRNSNVYWNNILWSEREMQYTLVEDKDSLDQYFTDPLFLNNSYVDVTTSFKGKEVDVPMDRIKKAVVEMGLKSQNVALLGPHGTAKSALTSLIASDLAQAGADVFMIDTIVEKHLDSLSAMMTTLAENSSSPVVFIFDDGGVLLANSEDEGNENAYQAFMKKIMGSMKNREKYAVLINANTKQEEVFPGALDAHRVGMVINTKNIDLQRADVLVNLLQERSDTLVGRGKYFDIDGWHDFRTKNKKLIEKNGVPCGGVLKFIRTTSVDEILEGNINAILEGKELPQSTAISGNQPLKSKTSERYDAEVMLSTSETVSEKVQASKKTVILG